MGGIEEDKKVRKIIIKWLFGADIPTYWDLLDRYGESLQQHKNTLDRVDKMIDRYENDVKLMDSIVNAILKKDRGLVQEVNADFNGGNIHGF